MTGRTPVRDLAIGIGAAFVALGLVFFGTVAAVEIATLALTVVMLIWFSTVDPSRLVGPSGRPAAILFGLAALGVALVLTASLFLRSLTQYLGTALALSAFVVGLTRAVTFGWDPPGRER